MTNLVCKLASCFPLGKRSISAKAISFFLQSQNRLSGSRLSFSEHYMCTNHFLLQDEPQLIYLCTSVTYTANWYGKVLLTMFTPQTLLHLLENEVLNVLPSSTQTQNFQPFLLIYKCNLFVVSGILIRLWVVWHVLISQKQSQNLSNVKTSTFVYFPQWPHWNSLPK